jgi:gliding motility-associated-like protein
LTATPDIIGGTYLWSNNIQNSSITVSPSVTSTYSVLYTVNGCANTTSANITVNDIPSLSILNDTICEGETGTINTTPSQPGGTYLWEDNSALSSLTDSPILTTDYEVVYTLNSCPSIPQYGTIVVNPIPIVSVSDTVICEGGTAVLSANVSLNGGVFLWNNGENTAVITDSPIGTTDYDVSYELDGCIALTSAVVNVQSPSPLGILISDTAGCAPLTVSFTNPLATSGSDCIWSINNGDQVTGCNASYTFENGGCYDVNLTVDDGVCISTTSEVDIICLDDAPNASFIVVPPLLTETSQWVQMNNNSNGAVDYLWDFGDGDTSTQINPQHMYTDIENGFLINLIAYSIQGCSDTAQLALDYQEEPIIYIPNTFTPDGDEHNHVFLPVFTSGYDPYNYEMMIFNRWGEVIFESRDAAIGWDGSYGIGAKGVEDGVYTYKIVYKVKKTDERRLIVGHVTLIR